MSTEELNSKLDNLARKRDYAADVLNKPMVALSYQQEIDKLASQHRALTPTAQTAAADGRGVG